MPLILTRIKSLLPILPKLKKEMISGNLYQVRTKKPRGYKRKNLIYVSTKENTVS